MARVIQNWEWEMSEADIVEKARARRAQALAQSQAAKAAEPTSLIGNLEKLQAELAQSVSESKTRLAEREAAVAEGYMAQGEAAEAQAQARQAAEEIAKETDSYINPRTGIITPNPELKKSVVDGNKDGGDKTQFVEYEYSKDFTKRRAKYFNPATGQFTYSEWEDAPLSKEDFDAMQAKKLAEEAALNEKRDAFALIEATMRSYGFNENELKEIVDYIQAGLLNPKLGSNQLLLQLRQLPSYKTRFAGNEERRARGLNAISEAAYLQQEMDYTETLRLYGQQRLGNRSLFATLIGNTISNTELGRRVNIAVNRLQNSDPAIITQLKTYFPTITDSDIVSYFLNPKETLPELEAKTTTAEIGATAKQFGLAADFARASDLQKYGVDLARARTGYEAVARVLPRTIQLSDIYKQAGIEYNQTVAEQEEFKGLASARRAREQLAGLEIAAFSGQSGLGRGSLGSQTGGQI